MATGCVMALCLGLLWVCVGATITAARDLGCPIFKFYFIGSTVAAALSWGYLLVSGGGGQGGWKLGLVLAVGVLFNALGQALTMRNLASGGRALAMTLPQVAFVVPFLVAVLFWREAASAPQWLGVGLIAMAALGCVPGRGAGPLGAVGLGLAAAALIGLGQVALIVPSRAAAFAGVSCALRVAWFWTASAVFLGVVVALGKDRRNILPRGRAAALCLVWGAQAALSFLLLFKTLDVMGALGMAGLVYALASTTSIVGYALYVWLRLGERPGQRQVMVISLIVAGLVAIRVF